MKDIVGRKKLAVDVTKEISPHRLIVQNRKPNPRDSNHRPLKLKAGALPTALIQQKTKIAQNCSDDAQSYLPSLLVLLRNYLSDKYLDQPSEAFPAREKSSSQPQARTNSAVRERFPRWAFGGEQQKPSPAESAPFALSITTVNPNSSTLFSGTPLSVRPSHPRPHSEGQNTNLTNGLGVQG